MILRYRHIFVLPGQHPPMVWSPPGLASGRGPSIRLCKTTSHPFPHFVESTVSTFNRIQRLQRLLPSSTINHTHTHNHPRSTAGGGVQTMTMPGATTRTSTAARPKASGTQRNAGEHPATARTGGENRLLYRSQASPNAAPASKNARD